MQALLAFCMQRRFVLLKKALPKMENALVTTPHVALLQDTYVPTIAHVAMEVLNVVPATPLYVVAMITVVLKVLTVMGTIVQVPISEFLYAVQLKQST